MVKRQAQLPTHLSTIQRYGLAVLCVLVALGGSLLLERFHLRDVALPLFLFANAIASWYGGTGPAVLAILLSCVSFDYFFIEPLYTLYISRFDFPYVIVFVSFTSLVAWFSAVRRRIEGELRQARDELEVRPLIDVIPQQVFVFDSDWRPLFANRRELEYTGLTPQESQSKDAVAKLFHPEDLKKLELLRERARVDGAPFEMEARIQGKDGEYRWFLMRDNPYLDEQGRVLRWYGTRTDIDGRKRGEKEMRNLASLVENSTDFIGLASLEGEVLFVNGAGQGMVGLAGNEQVGETKIPDYMAEQNLQRFQNEVLPAVFRDGRWEGETIFRHFQTGASIPMWQHIFFITEEGSGRRLALATICRDISERKRSEERFQRAQAELAHVARLTTMGELAASIAHEVNQPISGVVMNGNACLRWLEGDSPNLDEAREAARRIVRDGKRAGDVIARIRALATKTTTAKGPMDMNEAIRAVMDLARDELFRNRVSLRTEFAEDLSPVLGDRVQLQQVILNLVMNGVEAMSTVGERRRELVIRTQNDETDHVRVTVRDSGIGLDLQSKERIFDAFYTTKSGGMGMGLSISRSIVQSHGGRLWAVANDGPGTTFQFTVQKHQ